MKWHDIIQIYNRAMWEWQSFCGVCWMMKYSAIKCQSHKTLLWIWIRFCNLYMSSWLYYFASHNIYMCVSNFRLKSDWHFVCHIFLFIVIYTFIGWELDVKNCNTHKFAFIIFTMQNISPKLLHINSFFCGCLHHTLIHVQASRANSSYHIQRT